LTYSTLVIRAQFYARNFRAQNISPQNKGAILRCHYTVSLSTLAALRAAAQFLYSSTLFPHRIRAQFYAVITLFPYQLSQHEVLLHNFFTVLHCLHTYKFIHLIQFTNYNLQITLFTFYNFTQFSKRFAARLMSHQTFWKIQFLNYTVYILLYTAAIRNTLIITVFVPSISNTLTELRGPTRPPTAEIPTAHFTQIFSKTFAVRLMSSQTFRKIQFLNYTFYTVYKKIPKKIRSQTLQLSDLLEIIKYKLHNFTVYSLLHSAALSVAVFIPSLSKPLAGPNPPAYGGNTYSIVSLFHSLQKYS
jgi:hypothetical protein